jgi:dipeptidyl aminopeptidase/acylaminoacyl peptidase
VVSFDPDGGDRREVTSFTAPVRKKLTLRKPEEVIFEGADGDPVQMWVLHPAKPRKGRKRKPPLLHLIHGGPHGSFGDVWHWRWNSQVFAAKGYAVAMVNFHGSLGWGQDFASSIVGEWGDKPYRDILAATDHLIEAGKVSAKRLAAAGGSYGGYLSSWIASQTDRFKCIVNHAGVCDLQAQMGCDIPQGWPRSAGGDTWSDPDGLDRYNPIRHASGFKSPMLVLHGEQDYRVPYYQALQIYNTYKARGLEARLVCYPDENHWILKPKNNLHWYGEFLGWLKRWV